MSAVPPMPIEAADWVYENVLTRRYKESAGAIEWTGARETRRDEGRGAIRLRECCCQWTLCGRCSDGRPDRCAHSDWTPPLVPETWIHARRGVALTAVWRKGKPCSWLCTNVRLGQLDLFDLAGGAR